MTPETEEKIAAVEQAYTEKTAADRVAAEKTAAYREALTVALAAERGVQAEIARRIGVHRDTLRLDADPAKRHDRIKRRAKSD